MSEVILERKRLLHFFTDGKVTNDAIESFEIAFPNENLFLVLSKDGSSSLVKPHKNTLFLSFKSSELKDIIKDCKEYGEVIFHSMDYEFTLIIRKMEHPNINWVVWGGDLYESLLYRKGYQLYTDENLILKVRANKIPVMIYKMLVSIRDYYYYWNQKKANQKINIVTAYACDFDLLVKYYPKFSRCKRKDFFYYPIEKMLDEHTRDVFVSGRNVWVNPAAIYNGNHIDIFNRLSNFKSIEKICVPLSYGYSKWARYVEEEGRKIFGDKLDPMLSFIPKHDYYKRFLESNSFIFGHLRQCAVGNIMVAFYLGAKVFLFKNNPLYGFYKDLGFVLYSIDDNLTEEELLCPLTDKERLHNRRIVIKNYSYNKVIELIKKNF